MLDEPAILITDQRLDRETLRALTEAWFGDMVKYVVDLERRVVAVGGQLHADGEAMLLEQGSRQENLWGANYYPARDHEHCIEYVALINIRPGQGNRSMEIEDSEVRGRVRDLTYTVLGRGKEDSNG